MTPSSHFNRRQLLRWARRGALACAGLSVLLPACDWDGNFTVLGYTTTPNYDCKYKTVRVPIFLNKTPIRGLEFDLTEAIMHEIDLKTPMKSVAGGQPADTELVGAVIMRTKNLLSVNQLNEVREGEIDLTVELVWRDLKTGQILTRPGKRAEDASPFDQLVPGAIGTNAPGLRQNPITTTPTLPSDQVAIQTPPPAGSDPTPLGPPRLVPDPLAPVPPWPPKLPPGPPPLKLVVPGYFIPELGQSTTSAYQQCVNKMATQIVSAMEKFW